MKRILPLILLGLTSLATACDDSSQPAARDRAVEAVCDRFKACGAIRPSGGSYVSDESCRVDQAGHWERLWPPQDCDGKIDPAQLDLCIQTINLAECGEALDIANILLVKCPKSKVCTGRP